MEQDSQYPRPDQSDNEVIQEAAALEELMQQPGWAVFMSHHGARKAQALQSLRVPNPDYSVDYGRGAADALDGLLADLTAGIAEGKTLSSSQRQREAHKESRRIPPTIRRGGGSLASG